MVKLTRLKAYDIKDIPDEVVQELSELIKKGGPIVVEALVDEKRAGNLTLAALSRIHAAIIVNLISDEEEEVKKAAQMFAVDLIRNIEFLTKIKVLPDNLSSIPPSESQ